MNEKTMTTEEFDQIQKDLEQIAGTIRDPETAKTINSLMEHLTAMTTKITNAQTTPQTFFSKLKSRKFWMALIGAAAGVCGMLNSNGNVTAILIFVVLEVCSIFGYFFTEGTIDNTRTKELIQMANQIAAIIGTLTPTMLDSSAIEVEAVGIPTDEPDAAVPTECSVAAAEPIPDMEDTSNATVAE